MTTFAYDPLPPKQAPSVGGAAPIRAGFVQGPTQTGLIQYDPGTNLTTGVGALLKIGADKLAPVAKKMQEDAFLVGMQRAASGEALTSIINEQPAYTKIFGKVPLIEGARAYTAQAKAAEWASATEAKMAELRTKAPESMAQYIGDSFKQFSTGDSETDNLIRRTITEQAPSIIKHQTKEHYKYQQERAKESRIKSFTSTGQLVHEVLRASDGMYTQEEREDKELEFVAGFQLFPGMDIDSWRDDINTTVSSLAQSGSFHAIRAMERNGIFVHMKTEDRIRLEAGVKKAEMVWATEKGKAGLQEQIWLAEHNVEMGRVTPEEALHWMRDENSKYMKDTGSSVPLFDLPDQNSMVRSAQSARTKLLAAQADAMKEAAQQGLMVEKVTDRLYESSPYHIVRKSMGNVKEKEALDIAHNLFTSSDRKGRVNFARTWTQEGDRLQPSIRGDLARQINAANPDHVSENFMDVAAFYQDLRQTVGGAAAVASAFDPDHTVLLDSFLRYGGLSGEAKEAGKAFELAKRDQMLSGIRPLGEKQAKDAREVVKDKLSRGGFFGFFATKPNAASTRMVEQLMAREVSKLHTLTGPAMYEQAWQAVTTYVQPLGQYVYTKDPSREFKPLETILTKKAGGDVFLSDEDVGEAADRLMKSRFEAIGGRADAQVHLFRKGDSNGVAQFEALSFDDEATPKGIVFTSDDLLEEINRVKLEGLDSIAAKANPMAGAYSQRAAFDRLPQYNPLSKE